MEDKNLESAVYTISKPLQYAGSIKNDALLNQLKYDLISLRDGCSLVLKLENDILKGATETGTCLGSLRGTS